jgi:hypothetical protein
MQILQIHNFILFEIIDDITASGVEHPALSVNKNSQIFMGNL